MSRGQTLLHIPISAFKAQRSRLVGEVERTRQPLLITRRGIPVVKLVPAGRRRRRRFVLGDMVGTCEIVGDVVSSVIGVEE